MNKVLDESRKKATKSMLTYIEDAEAFAKELVDHLEKTKGWKCDWHLCGEGIDTITITVTEESCCCWNEVCSYEGQLMDIFSGLGPHISLHTLSRKYDCAVHT